jgi:hypothetical protein
MHRIAWRSMSNESNRLVAALREAAEAITAAKVPAKLHEIAFAKSLDHLLGTPPQESQAADLRQTSERQQDSNQVDTLGRIAAKLKIGSAIAERVFAVDGDEVHLGVARKALADSRKAATQEIAYLIAAGRQASGLEEITAASVIRDVCEQVGVLDGNNYGAAIRELQGHGFLIKGSGNSRELKINQVGYEKASEIVTCITSEAAK